MSDEKHLQLGRRERQIMDVIYRRGRASVTDVLSELPDPPTYSAVRGMLRLLETKGFVTHRADGLRYLYSATVNQRAARRFLDAHYADIGVKSSIDLDAEVYAECG